MLYTADQEIRSLKSWTTLVFMRNSTLREKFSFNFLGFFLLVLTKFSFWEED